MFYYLGFASAGDLLAASGCLLGILYEDYSGGQWTPLDKSLPFYILDRFAIYFCVSGFILFGVLKQFGAHIHIFFTLIFLFCLFSFVAVSGWLTDYFSGNS